jgi:hypothetical protein
MKRKKLKKLRLMRPIDNVRFGERQIEIVGGLELRLRDEAGRGLKG